MEIEKDPYDQREQTERLDQNDLACHMSGNSKDTIFVSLARPGRVERFQRSEHPKILRGTSRTRPGAALEWVRPVPKAPEQS